MTLKNASILVIDDDTDVLTAVRLLLKTEVKDVVTEKNPQMLQTLLNARKFDVILLDMNFTSSINTGNEGLFWLRKIKELKSDAAVIMITAYGDVDLAVRSLKDGAADFVVKPWHNDRLIGTIKEVLKKREGSGSSERETDNSTIIGNELLGESETMQAIFYKIEKLGPTDANILVLGENGTGKDLIAKAIHQHSLRADKPFVKVDVGALTDSLFESELFGHKKGAFTDAREDRAGGNWIYKLNDAGTMAYKVDIQLGMQSPDNYEVLNGLQPGDKVITSSYENYGNMQELILKKQ